ncbi:MAG: hypothetical protein WAU42_14660 [Solirubrobacteraceae bacterium]
MSTAPITLDPETIRAIAEQAASRTVEMLRDKPVSGLVDAATVANALGVSRDCVYAHVDALGGERIGTGPRGRLRFDLDRALAAWTARCHSKESHRSESPVPASHSASRQRQRVGSSAGLLPIKGSVTSADSRRECP